MLILVCVSCFIESRKFHGPKIEEDPLEFIKELSKVMNLVGVILVILVFRDLIKRISRTFFLCRP